MDRAEAIITGGTLLAFTAIIGLGVFAAFQVAAEEKRWNAFAAEHCHVVAYVSGDTFNTVSSDGRGRVTVGIGSTSEKTGWLCDDGITYYR